MIHTNSTTQPTRCPDSGRLGGAGRRPVRGPAHTPVVSCVRWATLWPQSRIRLRDQVSTQPGGSSHADRGVGHLLIIAELSHRAETIRRQGGQHV